MAQLRTANKRHKRAVSRAQSLRTTNAREQSAGVAVPAAQGSDPKHA